jgi:hypothetical protein
MTHETLRKNQYHALEIYPAVFYDDIMTTEPAGVIHDSPLHPSEHPVFCKQIRRFGQQAGWFSMINRRVI